MTSLSVFMQFQAKYLTRNTVAGSVDAVKSLDDYIMQLAVSGT